jgi:2-polyprenyl-3-methyl-5-hydroxy-6-metoxy-1,4-benzoquinol methylase
VPVKTGDARHHYIQDRLGRRPILKATMTYLTTTEFIDLFTSEGTTDIGYLGAHYKRFCVTKEIFESTWPKSRGRVLDIGAHWLHQAVLYAREGYKVTAGDFPGTISQESVQRVAKRFGVDLIEYTDLENAQGLTNLPDNSFDVILFTEIIEHLTFNPIRMWRELYRLLSPGGRIVVTTPNFYSLSGRLWSWQRLRWRMGGGISVDDIIRVPTYGHHWKEYSLRELARYFELLSKDFVVHKAVYVENYYAPHQKYAKVSSWLERNIRVLRPNVQVEIQLTEKVHGVIEDARW